MSKLALAFLFSYELTFTGHGFGSYVKEANYGSEVDITSGPFEFSLSDSEHGDGGEHDDGNLNGGEPGTVESPFSLSGLEVEIHEQELLSNGEYNDLGVETVTFQEYQVSAYDSDTQSIETETYFYEKISATTATITLGVGAGTGDSEIIQLNFLQPGYAEGNWTEVDGGETYQGTLTFRILGEGHNEGNNTEKGETPVDPTDPGTGGEPGTVESPFSLSGLEVEIHEQELLSNGEYNDLGVETVTFQEYQVSAYDSDTQSIETETYFYEKTSATTATITLGVGAGTGDSEIIQLNFLQPGYAEGNWTEVDGGETYQGTLTFRILGEGHNEGNNTEGGTQTNRGTIRILRWR